MLLLLVLAALTVRVELPEAVSAVPLAVAGESSGKVAEKAGFEAMKPPLALPAPEAMPAPAAMPAFRALQREAIRVAPDRPNALRVRTPVGTFGVELDEQVLMLVVDVEDDSDDRGSCERSGELAC